MDQFFWTEDNKYPMACRAQYRAVGKAEGEEYLRWGACPCEEEPEEVWTSYWCLPPVTAALHDSAAACSPADASADTGRYRREEEMSRGRSKKKKKITCGNFSWRNQQDLSRVKEHTEISHYSHDLSRWLRLFSLHQYISPKTSLDKRKNL